MDVPRFSLMRLPEACLQNVLRILNPIQLFEISLASKKSKDLAQSLKFKTSKFILHIEGRFLSIKLHFRSRKVCLFSNYLEVLNSVKIHYFPYSNEMDQGTFLNHLKFIFNTEKIEIDFVSNPHRFEFEPCFEGRRDVESISLRTFDQEENRTVLNIIKPSRIYMSHVTRPRDILIQNIDYLRASRMIVRLEDLLIMNIKNLEIGCSMFPAKVLNQFLKLWTRGSNLQLERLQLNYQVYYRFMNEAIFNRLKTHRNTTVKYFKSANGTRKITGGLDIFRFDGTMATVFLRRLGGINWIDFEFEMLVWHDHCIAKETDR
ncbi:unnamed protein product [Caenorhabditis brenneri]